MIHQFNISLHVIAGILALLIGIISFFSKKGGKLHTYAGRAFILFMTLVVGTAAIGVLFFRDRPFLSLITIQSAYLTISGFRALKYKEKGPGWIDLMIVLGLLSFTTIFVWNLSQSNIVWPRTLVYYTLGFILFESCYDLLRLSNVFRWSHAWLPEHFIKMTCAYSALFSAGFGTVMSNLGPLTQIISANLGGVLLIIVLWVYRRFFRPPPLPQASSMHNSNSE